MAKEADQKKVRRPKALKRDLQNQKRRLRNKTFKSRVKTTVRTFEDVLGKGDAEATQLKLDDVYSIMDKAVKKGIFKLNKASRLKSRLAARSAAKK